MLTRKQNAMLTQTGRGTPMGDVMRRYWDQALPGASRGLLKSISTL